MLESAQEEEEGPHMKMPPPKLKSVIDRMATYFAKNGPDFEYVVRSKKDERFDFVHSWNEYYPYYSYMKNISVKV